MRSRHINASNRTSSSPSISSTTSNDKKKKIVYNFQQHDWRIGSVILPPILLLFIFGGQTIVGIFSFCFLFLYVADLMKSTTMGVYSSAFLHVCVTFALCVECVPLVKHSFWNINIVFLIIIIGFQSFAWSLMHFHELRKVNSQLLLKPFEKIIVVALPSVCVSIIAWGTLSFFGAEYAPWITMCYACYVDFSLGSESLVSSFDIGSNSIGNTIDNKIHTSQSYWISKCSLMLPSLFHWGLHHNVLPPSSFLRSTIVCDQITITLIPILFVLIKRRSIESMNTVHRKRKKSNRPQILMTSLVVVCILMVYWYRHRQVLIHHQKSILRLFGITQHWDTVIVLGVPSSISLLLVLYYIGVNTIYMLPCVIVLYTSLLTCLGTWWVISFILSCIASWYSLRAYRLYSNSSDTNINSAKMNLYGKDMHSGSLVRREIIQNYLIAVCCIVIGWFIGCWKSYGNLTGKGFVWEGQMMLLGGSLSGSGSSSDSSSSSVKQSVATVSLFVVLLNGLIFIALPLLLSYDIGNKKTAKIAGKLFVLHAAGTVMTECLLSPYISGRIGHSGMYRSTLHVLLTSVCGFILSWCMSSMSLSNYRKKKKYIWFRSLPVQDSWMAACIHTSKLASLLPTTNTSDDISAALGTFCMLTTLTAPFVWYDPGVQKTLESTSNNDGFMMFHEEDRLDEDNLKKIYLSKTLAAVHILVATVGITVYRKIVVMDLLPFFDTMTGGLFSNLIFDERDGRLIWLKSASAVGLQIILLGSWICAICIRHFPNSKLPKNTAIAITIFGVVLCLLNPSLNASLVWHSFVVDTNLLSYIQRYNNPFTGHVFYAEKIGLNKMILNANKGLWRPWTLLVLMIILISKMSNWIEGLGNRKTRRRRSSSSNTSNSRNSNSLLSSSMSVINDLFRFRSLLTNVVLGILSACWLLSAPMGSGNNVISSGLSFVLEFISIVILVTLCFTVFERILLLPASTIISSNILPMYAWTLALLMFHICLVEVNAMIDPDIYVRRNVHPLSTTLTRVVGGSSRGSRRIRYGRNFAAATEIGVHEIERLMAIHGAFHFLFALLVKLKYDGLNPFQQNGNKRWENSNSGDRNCGKSNVRVQSVAERMLALGIGKSTSIYSKERRNSSSQQITIENILDGQRVLRAVGVTSTVVCTVAVGIVCLTRSAGKYYSIVISSFVLILLPQFNYNKSRILTMATALYIYATCSMNIEAFGFDIVGASFRVNSNSISGGDDTWSWGTPFSNVLTLLGIMPLQRTIIRMLWSGGVGGRDGISGLILPMPLSIVSALFTESNSVLYSFYLSVILWCYLVWTKWY
jgi:hypothetical protein